MKELRPGLYTANIIESKVARAASEAAVMMTLEFADGISIKTALCFRSADEADAKIRTGSNSPSSWRRAGIAGRLRIWKSCTVSPLAQASAIARRDVNWRRRTCAASGSLAYRRCVA